MEDKTPDLLETSITLIDRCIRSTERALYNNRKSYITLLLLEQLKNYYNQKCKILEERIDKGLPLEDPPEIVDLLVPRSYKIKDGGLVPILPRVEE
jgi:hypothetical protein